MTIAPEHGDTPTPVETVAVTIDGFSTRVPKGTLIIRAAEHVGVQIPRFCDHPLLDPVGACRQCLVEVEGQRKPIASCTMPVADGMVIATQLTSPVAEKAQRGNMEMLLINHPLDCPICDKGGECPLQNQAMSNGQADSRFRDVKRTFPKPLAISTQVLLDRERCVQCARCTRFAQQIAGDPFIELFERGALEQVGVYADEQFRSYFSGNTVQICPVGALTGAQYRFRARPFDLMSTPSVCEHCASGCAQRTDWRRGKVMRRLAGEDPEVNEEWNCDKGRWSFSYATAADRFTRPMVRAADGELKPSSWPEALERAATGLADARAAGGVGVLPGGRLTVEDAYAYAKFARVVLGTNDVDMRARPHSAEELEFLAARVAGVGPDRGVTYRDLERAPAVLLAGFEPEEESPIVFLRLRKGARDHGVRVYGLAPFRGDGLRKMSGTLVRTVPGAETEVLAGLAGLAESSGSAAPVAGGPPSAVTDALRASGAVILVGERLAEAPGALSAAAALARATGAGLAWVPRRAGERGAIEAGALPTLLPGARPVADPGARAEVERAWGASLPAGAGRDTDAILAAVRDRSMAGLLVGGVDPGDLPDPALARVALDAARFVVSLELRPSVVTEHADVVLPVAPAVEKAGTYLDWEGRARPFDLTLRNTGALPDLRVLHALAEQMDVELGLPTVETARAEIARLGTGTVPRPADPDRPGPGGPGVPGRPVPAAGQAVLASWRLLLDVGSLQDGEPYLAGTRKPSVLHLSPATAAEIGAADGESVTVRTARGEITLPLVLADLPDRVVWVPTNSPDSAVRRSLGAVTGALVTLVTGGSA
ncbi:MAG TPA: NADH-quinone oxidoreductase subunit G [Mycobacteriales bacterium]|nr:NADH-quinone oxidoreductase subunit G [Mycobacteriales bacterium]